MNKKTILITTTKDNVVDLSDSVLELFDIDEIETLIGSKNKLKILTNKYDINIVKFSEAIRGYKTNIVLYDGIPEDFWILELICIGEEGIIAPFEKLKEILKEEL